MIHSEARDERLYLQVEGHIRLVYGFATYHLWEPISFSISSFPSFYENRALVAQLSLSIKIWFSIRNWFIFLPPFFYLFLPTLSTSLCFHSPLGPFPSMYKPHPMYVPYYFKAPIFPTAVDCLLKRVLAGHVLVSTVRLVGFL